MCEFFVFRLQKKKKRLASGRRQRFPNDEIERLASRFLDLFHCRFCSFKARQCISWISSARSKHTKRARECEAGATTTKRLFRLHQTSSSSGRKNPLSRFSRSLSYLRREPVLPAHPAPVHGRGEALVRVVEPLARRELDARGGSGGGSRRNVVDSAASGGTVALELGRGERRGCCC